MAGLAVSFGAVSYFAGNQWLERQAEARLNEIENQRTDSPAVELTSVVVATEQLRFGEDIPAEKLKLVSWPKDAVPESAFSTIEELTGENARKVINLIEPGEPVLATKVTGDDRHAGLAGIISEGMRAVTIPVDLVNGVGGFVMPGDRVDIVLTKRDRDSGDQDARIIMDNVKVLSIDQDADRASDGAKVAKSVTLETNASGAQRLALANSIGKLSLLLRSAGDENIVDSGTLTSDDLSDKPVKAETGDDSLFSFLNQKKKEVAKISVVRGDEIRTHTVPILENENATQ